MDENQREPATLQDVSKYVHPMRVVATKNMQALATFMNVHGKGPGAWSFEHIIIAVNLISQGLIRTTNQLFNDVERLQHQIDKMKSKGGENHVEGD